MAIIVLLSAGILSAQSLKMAVTNPVKAKRCLEEGKRLEALAYHENAKSQKRYEQALQKYLCAAHAGSVEGAIAAAGLSQSGMAPSLPRDTLVKFYQFAIDSGDSDGYAGMALLFCENEPFFSCRNPVEARKWLTEEYHLLKLESALENFADTYLSPFEGDTSVAYACYRKLGNVYYLKKLLKKSPNIDTTKNCEIR